MKRHLHRLRNVVGILVLVSILKLLNIEARP